MARYINADDRALILDALAKYCWGYDEGDFDMLADAFTEDATTGGTVTHTDIGWGPVVGRAEIVAVLSGIRRSQTDQRRHIISTGRFEEQTPTTAKLSIYIVVLASKDGETRVATAGRYLIEAVKETDGEWRIRRLDAILDSAF
ncbi:nuclear transport factor 2 family protein [Paraburkholderia sabiae]|uniref:Nuclear transport factor 2 family protein n=1 Tax=Paraburkholderia sabiae TaxID=273251 RepID=A0ABU9QK98_9BURK|nr:nuclear transport factor 2 family protein [Paraburkholderia sabiae]WJZ76486.1 nuclear transport factor 2 family protein [Paraburkholderia sabiae]CAD6560205.1 hypothetical protein LMG24235_06874 [Paraburkholderia sabiae]